MLCSAPVQGTWAVTIQYPRGIGEQKFTLEQNFGRSLPRDKALMPELFLAYALNGDPLTKHQGAPLRLLVPGYYGVCNVKWLTHIHLQEDAYLGSEAFRTALVEERELNKPFVAAFANQVSR